jgi:hypothetical protein
MNRRALFGTLSLGLLAGLTATSAEAATRRTRRPTQTAADCPRSAPCTSSRGGRYWISDDGRRHNLRRRRTTTPA